MVPAVGAGLEGVLAGVLARPPRSSLADEEIELADVLDLEARVRVDHVTGVGGQAGRGAGKLPGCLSRVGFYC